VDQGDASASASRCRAQRVVVSVGRRHGRTVLRRIKTQRPSRSSVRYSCAPGPGGAAKLTVRRHRGLRKAIGKTLDLSVVRAPRAPARQATLTFGFF
jgi:hypothetical protein